MKQLTGKVALVTGAGSGIGRANAVVMAARGAALIINDRDGASAMETVAMIEKAGGRALACIADVSVCAEVVQAIELAQRSLGAVDILVNNAGIAGGRLAFEDIDEENIDRMFAITVKGAMFCVRAVLPGMKARRRGKIINTSSITAMGSHKFTSNYAASKAAVIGLTKAWAREFAEWNIQVNAVAPGRVRTPMVAHMDQTEAYIAEMKSRVPLGRQAMPDEIAGVVAFLASSDADYLTGQVISPNGGEVM